MLLFAEWAARRATPYPRLAAAFERGPYNRVLVLDPPGGAPGPARVTTNRWGMRGDDPPALWADWETWIAIGSSTTLCPYQDDRRTWPARLQARLRDRGTRAWIGNAGMDGVTAVSLEAMIDRVIRVTRPKGLLVLPGGADLARDLNDRWRRSDPFDEAFLRRLDRMRDRPPIRKRFGLWRWFDRGRQEFVHDSSGHKPWSPPALEGPVPDLPSRDSLLPSLPAYRESVRRMGRMAREMGIRAVFLTHPIAYGTDSSWARRESRKVVLFGREMRFDCATERRLRDAYNAALLSVCAADSLECFDLAASLSGHPGYFYDGSHFNDAGSDRAAELIAGYLARRD